MCKENKCGREIFGQKFYKQNGEYIKLKMGVKI